MKALLHDEPPAVRLPFLLGLHELQIILHEESRDELRPARITSVRKVPRIKLGSPLTRWQNSHLHPTDIPPQAHPRPSTKRKEEPLHISITPLDAILAF
jgi:hypothetical protein